MSQRNKQPPTTWDAYQRGRNSSFGSLDSVPEDENQSQNVLSSSATSAPRNIPENGDHDAEQNLRRRRSSITMKINSLRQMGGVNSIDNFARSFQRAANFREITPIRRGSITMGDAEDEDEDVTQETQGGPSVNKSLLRQQLEAHGGTPPDQVIQDEPENARQSETTPLLQPTVSRQTLRPHYPSGSLLTHVLVNGRKDAVTSPGSHE